MSDISWSGYELDDPVEVSKRIGEGFAKAKHELERDGIKSFLFASSSVEEFDERAKYQEVPQAIEKAASKYLVDVSDAPAKLTRTLRREFEAAKSKTAAKPDTCFYCGHANVVHNLPVDDGYMCDECPDGICHKDADWEEQNCERCGLPNYFHPRMEFPLSREWDKTCQIAREEAFGKNAQRIGPPDEEEYPISLPDGGVPDHALHQQGWFIKPLNSLEDQRDDGQKMLHSAGEDGQTLDYLFSLRRTVPDGRGSTHDKPYVTFQTDEEGNVVKSVGRRGQEAKPEHLEIAKQLMPFLGKRMAAVDWNSHAQHIHQAADEWASNAYEDEDDDEYMKSVYQADAQQLHTVASLLENNRIKEAIKMGFDLDTVVRDQIPDCCYDEFQNEHQKRNVYSKTAKDYSEEDRKEMAKKGWALSDGSFPIKNCNDVKNAQHRIGTTNHDEDTVKRHIVKRWKELNCEGNKPFTSDE